MSFFAQPSWKSSLGRTYQDDCREPLMEWAVLAGRYSPKPPYSNGGVLG